MAGTADSICSVIVTRPSSSIQEPNEQILRLMHSLGIDISRTREVMRHFSLSRYLAVLLFTLFGIRSEKSLLV